MTVRLFVGNIPYGVSEKTIRELFTQAGTVTSVFIAVDPLTGRPRGFAFVEMASEAEARGAVHRLHGHLLDGRPLRIELAEERERAPRVPAPYRGRARPGAPRRRRPERSPGR